MAQGPAPALWLCHLCDLGQGPQLLRCGACLREATDATQEDVPMPVGGWGLADIWRGNSAKRSSDLLSPPSSFDF